MNEIEKLSNPAYEKLSRQEREQLLAGLAKQHEGLVFDRFAHFEQYGKTTDTAVYKYTNGLEFVFVPGAEVTLGWDEFASGMDESDLEDFYEAFDLDKDAAALVQEMVSRMSPVRKAQIPPLLVERKARSIGWFEANPDDPRLQNKRIQNFIRQFYGYDDPKMADGRRVLSQQMITAGSFKIGWNSEPQATSYLDDFSDFVFFGLDDLESEVAQLKKAASAIKDNEDEFKRAYKKVRAAQKKLTAEKYRQLVETDAKAHIWLREDISFLELKQRVEAEGLRLPTLDEWEYLASGGLRTLWPWGDSMDYDLDVHIFDFMSDSGRAIDDPNFFGLRIAWNPYICEVIDDEAIILKGGDGGSLICGGNVPAVALWPVSPFYIGKKRGGQYDSNLSGDYTSYRRVFKIK
ncbi:MAG: formylglycine-generating enzyme family protein [Erysipelotrichaceae bacterium]|nr:formylglycine-generating enzyme family protein [Erysipelotrichaceae bacterium]